MKTTAVLLFPHFAAYELVVALSALRQAEKPVAFFSMTDAPMPSEEAMLVSGDHRIEADIDVSTYDSLLISGSMDPVASYLHDDRYLHFVKQFDRPDMVIGAISSGPILLSMNDMLAGKPYTCGVPEEMFEQFHFDPSNFVRKVPFVEAGNILTAHGFYNTDFGIRFCEMLGLDFDPNWYR